MERVKLRGVRAASVASAESLAERATAVADLVDTSTDGVDSEDERPAVADRVAESDAPAVSEAVRTRETGWRTPRNWTLQGSAAGCVTRRNPSQVSG